MSPKKVRLALKQFKSYIPKPPSRRPTTYESLLNAESAIGRTIFGPIPYGHQREFFNAKKNLWIWHESWQNQLGQPESLTIRYEVRETGVYKKIPNSSYQKITGTELKNFIAATHRYFELVKSQLYS